MDNQQSSVYRYSHDDSHVCLLQMLYHHELFAVAICLQLQGISAQLLYVNASWSICFHVSIKIIIMNKLKLHPKHQFSSGCYT